MRIPLLLPIPFFVGCGTLTPYEEAETDDPTGDDGSTWTFETTETMGETEETACDPADTNDAIPDLGDSCGMATDLGALADSGLTVQFTGDLHASDDQDWFVVHAVDLGDDEIRGWEDFRLDVTLIAGDGSYQFRVARGGCGGAPDCSEIGYDSYSWFIEDNEPDELGETPTPAQACGQPPLDLCEDWTGDYVIEVLRVDGALDCTPYTIEVGNGVWPPAR